MAHSSGNFIVCLKCQIRAFKQKSNYKLKRSFWKKSKTTIIPESTVHKPEVDLPFLAARI